MTPRPEGIQTDSDDSVTDDLVPGNHATRLQVVHLRGFLIGIVESSLYGVHVSLVYTPIYNFSTTNEEAISQGSVTRRKP
jgi:hypothetical protein